MNFFLFSIGFLLQSVLKNKLLFTIDKFLEFFSFLFLQYYNYIFAVGG